MDNEACTAAYMRYLQAKFEDSKSDSTECLKFKWHLLEAVWSVTRHEAEKLKEKLKEKEKGLKPCSYDGHWHQWATTLEHLLAVCRVASMKQDHVESDSS